MALTQKLRLPTLRVQFSSPNIRGERLPRAEIINLGMLKAVVRTNPLTQPEEQSVWTGTISLAERLKKSELTEHEVSEALRFENLEPYYIHAAPAARVRCIDGRPVAHYGQAAAPADRPLGPQAPGGTVATALCRRVAGWGSFVTPHFTLSDDIEAIAPIFQAHGLTFGGHVDDHAASGFTGCGAIDKIPDIIQRITSPAAQEALRGLAEQLLGNAYRRDITDAIMGRFLSLQAKQAVYFVVDQDGNYHYRQAAIETLRRENPQSIETLAGEHREIGLVINLVPGTTFHRDQFSSDHEGRMQLFNYDVWRSFELAKDLFPVHATSSRAKRQQMRLLRARYITTRVLFGLATAMILTDGSLWLLVRKPVS